MMSRSMGSKTRVWAQLLGAFWSLCPAAGLAAPVISEVAWMGTQANFRDEWIEFHNPGENPVLLSDYELRSGSEITVLPAVEMQPGAYLVLEDTAETTSLVPDSAIEFSISLANSGEILRLCPLGRSAETEVCDIAHDGNGPWPAGDNQNKRTMVRVEPWSPGVPGIFRTWDGEASAVLDRLGDPISGTPSEPALWPPVTDAGPSAGDAGPPEEDGGVLDAGIVEPHDYPGLAITEIYFNPPTSSETGKEWVELANLSDRDIELDGSMLERLEGANEPVVRRSTRIEGTGLILAPGEYVVLAQTEDLDLGLCVGGNLQVLGSGNLQLANSGTQWLRISGESFSNMVKYAGSDVVSMGEGIALALPNISLDNSQPENWVPAQCSFADGLFGSPGVPNDDCFEEAILPCVYLDAGPMQSDAGLVPPSYDAGPNAAPSLEMTAPAADVSSEGFAEIIYSADDPDGNDSLEVSLYYDLDGAGYDGVRIASGLPAGAAQTYRWRTQGVPAGTYRIFGVARDVRGESAYAYAPGAVQVGGGVSTDSASIRLLEPDGVNDARNDGSVLIRWQVDMPPDAEGTVSLFYDQDAAGEDGLPILASIPVRGEAGAPGPREYLWQPTGLPQGKYTVYAVLDWTRGQSSAYSAYVNISGGESCAASPSGTGAWGALLLLFIFRRRGQRAMAN